MSVVSDHPPSNLSFHCSEKEKQTWGTKKEQTLVSIVDLCLLCFYILVTVWSCTPLLNTPLKLTYPGGRWTWLKHRNTDIVGMRFIKKETHMAM